MQMDDLLGSSSHTFATNLEQNSENASSYRPSSLSLQIFGTSDSLNLKPTTETVNQDSDPQRCRSRADLIDVFSDIVDDIAQMTGLSSIVAPLTDADPHTECFQSSIYQFLKDDLEDYLTEGNACDFRCGEEQECVEKGPVAEVGAAGEPDPVDEDNHNTRGSVLMEESPSAIQPYDDSSILPVMSSEIEVATPPRKKKKKKKKKKQSIVENTEEEPKNACCRCTIS